MGRPISQMVLHLVAAIMLSATMMAPALPREPAGAFELSAAAQKKTRVHRRAPAVKPAYRWRPADPSFDQQGRPYRPPPGLPCPIDLGYGRWTSCMYR
jgi:hypothetical protein